ASVAITTRNQGTLKRTTEKFPWSPDDPPAPAALQEKLDACFAAGVAPLAADQKARLIEQVRNIENVPDMSRFFAGIL
ncbi:MAG: hypothetical protein ABI547_08260, partial [Betaproteobacteria bacterium]